MAKPRLKKKLRRQVSGSVAPPRPDTPATPIPPTFQFRGINVLGIVFQLVPKLAAAEGENLTPGSLPVQLTVNAAVGVSEDKTAQLRLIFSVVPDPRVQPYNIVVDVAGVFSTNDGSTDELAEFCRRAAPAILFPYIREIIDRTTTYAPFGVVRLDPTNINQMVNQNPWGDVPQSLAHGQ